MNLDNNTLLMLIAGLFVILYLTMGTSENMRDLTTQRYGRQKKLSGRSGKKIVLDDSDM